MDNVKNRELKASRIRLGMTQKDVAKLIGIGETSYVHRENGKHDFSVMQLRKLKVALKLTNEQIINIFFE
ncbi:MAG: helix-turn-helix transcriptional regulator [Hyphomonadaceae bacterium]|nr:helix-turn-helix transcriptional regulator [Clostridia bacterium]